MQISIKGLLFSPKVTKLEIYQVTANVSNAEKVEYMKVKWKAFRAISKLYNIIKYIPVLPKRRAGFKTVLQDLEKWLIKVLTMDNDI